jgi:thiamine-monophosphate kinase
VGSTEQERIARLAAILGQGSVARGFRVGIGDDAAVVEAQDHLLVWTIDEQVEDVHFRRALCSFEDIGFRATMTAASDLAAMGARPLGALAAMVLPPDVSTEDLEAMARGQRQACDALGASVVGGNLSRGARLSVATTWLGVAPQPVLRSGAREGDGLYLCGDIGLASAGFRALDRGLGSLDADDALRAAAEAWRRPRARVDGGLRMASVASAAIDVSDGLAGDAQSLARASSVRVVLDEQALRACLDAATVAVARLLAADPLDLALFGGEDYALLCTSATPIDGFTRIGGVERGEGVVLRGEHGERAVDGGFDHFA